MPLESHQHPSQCMTDGPRCRKSRWVGLWIRACTLISGTLALMWLVLRSGTKPSRLAYPCQQAAMGAAVATFGVPAIVAIVTFRTSVMARLRTLRGQVTLATLSAAGLALIAFASFQPAFDAERLAPPEGYRPEVFLVNDARGIEPGRFGGVDDLITLMGVHGFKWHRAESVGLTSGPDGIINADDVVLIKINYQWDARGGTNTDVLRGVIRRVIEHPDTFTGEVVVCENSQFNPIDGFDRTENNAEEIVNSPHDVVASFQKQGYQISHYSWTDIRWDSVGEYSAGDTTDGYVVNSTPDPQSGIRVSYPKFTTDAGTHISYKYGVWSPTPTPGTYDADKLVVINIPVFKTHVGYGITASVKNHMGVVTKELSTNSHSRIRDGGLGSFLAEVRMPDLNILDCIWIHAEGWPNEGPGSPYGWASRRDQLVASIDPVALDVWATKYIMIPQIIENGYSSSAYIEQHPDNPNGNFREYLDNTMNEMLLGGIDTTNDYTAVKLYVWAGDVDRDGDLDLGDFAEFEACITGPDEPTELGCDVFDFNVDDTLDLTDVAAFQVSFTGSG